METWNEEEQEEEDKDEEEEDNDNNNTKQDDEQQTETDHIACNQQRKGHEYRGKKAARIQKSSWQVFWQKLQRC